MRTALKSPRPKKCRHCRDPFTPSRPLQAACSITCALSLTRAKQERERKALAALERKAIKAAKQRIKSKADYMREAQAEFNAFIRERDRDLPCISCGRHHRGQYHAGHYRTVGSSPELRFEPLNTHKQCAPCNNHKSGDIVNYRINLTAKIGAERVAWLEGPHEPKRYTIEDLNAIKAEYRGKLRELKGAGA